MKNIDDIGICEERVFERVYNENITPIRNFVYYQNGDLEKAEDIAQESLIRAWQNCKTVLLSKVKSFLFTTAKRLMLNQIRDGKVALKFVESNLNKVENKDPEFLLLEEEFKNKLTAAINGLNEKQRTTFLLNRIDKKSFAEIAEMEDVSVKAIEKRMGVTLRILKEKVEELGLFKI